MIKELEERISKMANIPDNISADVFELEMELRASSEVCNTEMGTPI